MKKNDPHKRKNFNDILFEVLYLTPGRKGISRYFRFMKRQFNIAENTISARMRVYDCMISSKAKDEKELKENLDLLIEMVVGDRVHQQESVTTEIFGQEFNHN